MKIVRVDRWRVIVPCKPRVLEREGRWYDPDWSSDPRDAGLSTFDRLPKWIIRIRTDSGLSGIGESFRGEPAEAIESGAAALVGKDPRALSLSELPLPPEADYETFEMALFDLLGRTWEVPAYQLLGGARQRRVAVDYWASRHAPQITAQEAAEAQRLQFPGIKLKMALASDTYHIAKDDPVVETVASIRERCGPDFTITIDPNFRFNSFDSALALAHELEPFNVLVLEDPFPWREDDLSSYTRFRRESPVPVAMHVGSPSAALAAIKAEAADYLNIRTPMTEFVRVAWMAEQAGIRCWHGSGVDLGIRDMSSLHASFAAANCTIPGDQCGNVLREDDLIMDPIPIRMGHVTVPTGPGLGVELDEEALKRYGAAETSLAPG